MSKGSARVVAGAGRLEGGLRTWWRGGAGVMVSAARWGGAAVLDQAVVSAGRFALTVLIGRLAGADELGLYAMGFAVVVIGMVVQESLLLTPYTVLGNQVSAFRRRRALGSMLVVWGVLVGVAVAGLGVVGGAWGMVGSGPEGRLLLVLALAWPGVMVHGVARRVAYAHDEPGSALALDVVVSGMQVGLVVWLGVMGWLTAEAAIGVLGGAGLVGGVVWCWFHRHWVGWDRRAVGTWLVRSWRFGRWLLGSQQARAVTLMVVTWGLAAAAGSGEAGRFAAAGLVVVAANPLLLGLGGVVAPRTAAAWKQGGGLALRQMVGRVTWGVALVMVGYAAVAGLVGGPVLLWVLGDSAYAGLGHAVAVLGVALAVRAVRMGWNSGIVAVGRPAWGFTAGVAELAVVAGLMGLFMGWQGAGLGVESAAYIVLAGSIVGTAVRAYAYRRLVVRAG